jgi:hypothetical protein
MAALIIASKETGVLRTRRTLLSAHGATEAKQRKIGLLVEEKAAAYGRRIFGIVVPTVAYCLTPRA